MSNKNLKFDDVVFAVDAGGTAVLVAAPEGFEALMDGSVFEDNCDYDSLENFPKEPGVYRCKMEYQFEQGYYEGYPADGESEWDFVPSDIKKINLKEQT